MTTILDDKDLSVAGYTNFGSTPFVDDQHNPGAGAEGDGVNNRLGKTGVLLSGVTDFSGIFWLLMDGNPSSDVWPISQLDSAGLQGIFFFISSDGTFGLDARTSATERTVSTSTATSITGNVYKRVGFSVQDNTPGVADAIIKLYVSGAEVSSYDFNSDHAGGTGWQNVTATAAAQQISLLSGQHFSRFVDAIVSRPFMTDTVLSAAEFLADYNAEVAAIGEGFEVDEVFQQRIYDSVYNS